MPSSKYCDKIYNLEIVFDAGRVDIFPIESDLTALIKEQMLIINDTSWQNNDSLSISSVYYIHYMKYSQNPPDILVLQAVLGPRFLLPCRQRQLWPPRQP